MWAAYRTLLERRPLATKALTAGAIMGLGDAMQQLVIERTHTPAGGVWRYDALRTARQGAFGVFFIGPVMHKWFAILDKVVPASKVGPLVKVGLDQAIIGPLVCFSFFSLMGLMEGQSPAQIENRLKNHFWPTLVMNWKVWPAIQLANFYLVPLPLRVLWANLGQFGWSMYLSHQAHKDVDHVPVPASRDE